MRKLILPFISLLFCLNMVSHINIFNLDLMFFTYIFDQPLGYFLVDFSSFKPIERERGSSHRHLLLTLLQVRSVRLSTTLSHLFVYFVLSNIVYILPSINALRRTIDVALFIFNWHSLFY